MSVLEVRHEFFDVEARDNEKLYQAFCNHVYLGQWELTRISLQILYHKRLKLNTNLEDLLMDIIRNPTAYCTASKSVPTPFHFAILLLEECRVKQYLDMQTVQLLKSEAIFKFLLAVGDIQPTNQVVQEFERLRTNTDAIPSTLLTDSMGDFLVELWLHDIPRVHAFIRLYLYSNISAVHTWLVNIHKRALEHSLQQMKTLNNNEQKNHLMDLLIALHFYACDTQEFRSNIREILKKIVIYATEANENSGQLFTLKLLYQTVLNNGYLARLISELESEYRRELLNNESVIIHFLKKNSFDNERYFWKEVYLYLIENKIDLISCVLNDAILMIQNRDYSSLDRLLNLEQLTALHLYIFLLGWTHVRTINDAIVLHDSINSLKTKSSILQKCLKLFQSQIDFITWLHNIRRFHDGVSPLPNMSDLLALLHTNSPLSLIHRYLDVQNIDSDEILDKLQKTVVDIWDDDEKVNRERRVHFPDDPNDESHNLSQISARMTFLGYLSINSALQRILSSDQILEPTEDFFAKTRAYLIEIHPLRFRLELLENIFSLVFIQQSELKIDETIDMIEQPPSANNSVSIPASTSEKFLSSLQSNFTNDSLLTSTNLSTKTQLSDRRLDRDFEVQSTDDVSVCSSSMSSVSASYYGIYRTGLVIDQHVLHQLLVFLRDHLAEIRTLNQQIQSKATHRTIVVKEALLDKAFLGCSIRNNEEFITRATKLNTILSETLWRYQLLTAKDETSTRQENRFDGSDNEENLLNNPSMKDLILPSPTRRHPSRQKKSRSRHSSSSTGSIPSLSRTNSSSKVPSPLVSQILSTRDNLLAICLKEGKITEANEVIRLLNMQDHPLAVEAKFSKLFRDTVYQLSNSYSPPPPSISTDSLNGTSSLAGLASLASSALGNSSLQDDITPLLESAQLSAVSSTLPTSSYFEPDHFLSLTLFDLAINAPTMSISKTLLEMSQHRLPLSRHVSSPASSLHNASNNKTSFPRIKTLHEMINNYHQLANLPNLPNHSLQDVLLDVTIPLDGNRAMKITQYYRRLEEHCRQYYANEHKSIPIEKQVKVTGELFENDPQAKFDLVAFVRNAPNQSKPTSSSSSSYINYFSIFHTYLQNFRTLLEKFPTENLPADVDLSKHSPLSLVHRIVARSSDIDLTQLQLMTSKLNIDISLAVSLNIIRPLFVDKTMSLTTTTTSSSSTRRTTLLQQQPIDIFFNRQISQPIPTSHSNTSTATKRQMRRSTTFLRRLTSKIDEFQNESQVFSEHPEKFIRTLLTKLVDLIRKILQENNSSRMTIEHIEKLIVLDDYDDILNTLPLFTYIDLDQLTTNEERICFYTNLHNFLNIISQIELIRTASTKIQTTSIFRNDLERLLFLLTTRCDIGQLKQLSLYDIRHYLLRQTILNDGLKFEIDPKGPFHKYSPTLTDQQRIQVGLLLNDCTSTSPPLTILLPELFIEQLQRSTRDLVDKCVSIKVNEMNNSIQLNLPNVFFVQFDQTKDNLTKFIGEFSSNNQTISILNENRTINHEIHPSRDEFSLNFDYQSLISQSNKTHRRRSSLPTSTINASSPIDFLPQSNTLPNHLIDSRTIAFVQEKSPALGQILQIYVQSVVHNQSIENDQTPLKSYFASLLLSPTLIESTSSIGDEWFRSIVLNDLTYQHDLLLYLCSLLWNQSKYMEMVQLFDSLLPSFIVHSSYCQILRDLALLNLIKETPKPDHAYNYLRKIHDCHLLVHATLTYLPRFDGPTCLKLLELCLTSCKKSHQDYVSWIQERLNAMYVYKTLCLGALAQFNKCMEKISKDENQLNFSMEDMKIKKTSSKCLTWQRAEEHSQLDPLAVVDMFIYERQFDMGHQWLNLLTNYVEQNLIDRVKIRLVEEHIHYLLQEENIGNGNRIIQVIDSIGNPNDQWHLCTDLMNDLSKEKGVTHTKSIPFSKLFIKFRLIQYLLGHFEENSEFFQGEYDRSKLCILATGLGLFFNCIPLEQTDSYVQLIGQPLLIVEQLLMNSSVDIAKTTIETLKILIEKYALQKHISVQQIDHLIEFYTKRSVQLNVAPAQEETPTVVETKPILSPVPTSQPDHRSSGSAPSSSSSRRKNSQDISPLGRRQNSGGSSSLLRSIDQRRLAKNSIPSTNTADNDSNLSGPSSPNNNSPLLPSPIPIPSNMPPSHPSTGDYLSNSFSGRTTIDEPSKQPPQFNVPIVAASRKSWVSDEGVTVCMCCNETRFSMLNRRHHCRRCGRVVCKTCSQHMTLIRNRQERTCKDCYQHQQTSPTPVANTRPIETPNNPPKKFDSFRRPSKPINLGKRSSIGQLYVSNNPSVDTLPSDLLFGTTFTKDTPSILEENPVVTSSSVPTGSRFSRGKKLDYRSTTDSLQKSDQTDTPTIPVVAYEVHYQLSGTAKDDTLRNDFRYDQSPSVSLCLSLIELHSDQYQGGKLLINLCEYLSEQLSTKQRNMEIDYGLVLSIIKNLLFTAKMKLMTVIIDDEQIMEQQKLIASCDMYNNLVDILNRLNMANCPLPALNDLLQQDTLRKIRKQLLDDERYQLAMDISTRCSLDTQTIWFQWGMAYLHIGQYTEAREKFDRCLQKNTETTDAIAKQQQRSGISQEKMLNDIIEYLESTLPLKYSMKRQYLTEQQTRQTGQTMAGFKYPNSLSSMPRLSDKPSKVIDDEILFYLLTYSDDAHLLDYYIRHERYTEAFEYKSSLTSFRDHVYIPLLKRNHIKHLFNYILSRNNNNPLTHHLRFVGTFLKEQEMYHSLQQLQLFMNDYINAAFTSIKLFTSHRTTYLDLFEKRLNHLEKAAEYFQHAKSDSEQTTMKLQSNQNKIDLQIEITRFINTQLKRLNTNGSTIFVNCPTLFDGKEGIIKLIIGLVTISDGLTNAFSFINRIIKELNITPTEVFVPCAEDLGKRHDYRTLQQLLQLIRENGYTDNKLHDDIIETCVLQTGSDVDQVREQDTLIQMVKNDDTRIKVCISVGKLRAAYLIAIRVGREDKVRLIRDEAQKSGQAAVYDICKRWLENRPSEQ